MEEFQHRYRHRRALRRRILQETDDDSDSSLSSPAASHRFSDATIWNDVLRLAAAAAATAGASGDAATLDDTSVALEEISSSADEPAKCSSDLYMWAREKARRIGFSKYLTLAEYDVPFLLYVFKHYIDDNRNANGREEYFGASGEYTDRLLSRHEETTQFWRQVDRKAAQNRVILLGMHGNDFATRANLVDTLSFLYPGRLRKDIKAEAKAIQALIEQIPDAYDNPILSLNALAVTADWISGRDAPDALLIGDGLLQFLHDSGLGDDGPDFIHSHEWGHHLQFDYHDASIDALLFNNKMSKGEATRRGEMMADAFGAYFLTHPNGGNLDENKVRLINDIAFSIGDCKIDKDAHHGTPLQRECAAVFGSKVALGLVGGESSKLIHPERFRKVFDTALPGMLQLDGDICSFPLDSSEDTAEEAIDTTIATDNINVTSDGDMEEQDGFTETPPTFSPTPTPLLKTIINATVVNETEMNAKPYQSDFELHEGRPVVPNDTPLPDFDSFISAASTFHNEQILTTGLLAFIIVIVNL